MKTFIKATVVTLALSFTMLYAGSGHSHDGGHGHSHTQVEVNKAKIENMATQELAGLVQNGKIDKSWSSTPILNMIKKQFHHNEEWVVSFENKEIKDKSKQTLYIFISIYGELKGANYTGQ